MSRAAAGSTLSEVARAQKNEAWLRAKQIGLGYNGLGRTKTEQNETGERSSLRGSGWRHACTCTKQLKVIGQQRPEMDNF